MSKIFKTGLAMAYATALSFSGLQADLEHHLLAGKVSGKKSAHQAQSKKGGATAKTGKTLKKKYTLKNSPHKTLSKGPKKATKKKANGKKARKGVIKQKTLKTKGALQGKAKHIKNGLAPSADIKATV